MAILPLAALGAALAAQDRLLGIDVGTKTLGLALSDATRTIATPLETVKRRKFSSDIQVLERLVDERSVGGFVLGLPVNMNGSEGPRCQATRAFAALLLQHLPRPLLLWDERWSTQAVTRTLLDADLSRRRRAQLVDKMAAAYILQGALDALSGPGLLSADGDPGCPADRLPED